MKAIKQLEDKLARDLGYTSYLSANGNWNVMNGDSHGDYQQRLDENVVFNFVLDKIDCGDW